MELELSMKERLNLINQYKILLELADKDSLEKKEYENLIEILERGYTRYYSRAISEISEEELSDKECKAVVDILDLYSDLYFYWHNDDEIQNTIDKSNVFLKVLMARRK
ncbi:YfbU family protein [Lactococcus lactis]